MRGYGLTLVTRFFDGFSFPQLEFALTFFSTFLSSTFPSLSFSFFGIRLKPHHRRGRPPLPKIFFTFLASLRSPKKAQAAAG